MKALGLCLVAAVACALLALPTSAVRGARHGRSTRGVDCAVCHTPEGWQVRGEIRTAAGFDHDLTGFPLRAGHLRASCVQCHNGKKELSRDCASCHVDEHRGKLGKACDSCHTPVSFRRTDAFALHSRTRLPLTGMHVLVDCNDCHRRTSTAGYASTPSQCFACHEKDYRRPDVHPVHDGSGGNTPLPRDCAECHRTDAFAPAIVNADRFLASQAGALSFNVREHDQRFVISRGSHRGAPCTSCHLDAQVREPRLVRCTGCHDHSAAILKVQHPGLGTPGDGSCLSCHAGGAAR
jgi:hypothetical protein